MRLQVRSDLFMTQVKQWREVSRRRMLCTRIGSEQLVHQSVVTTKFSGKQKSLYDHAYITLTSSVYLHRIYSHTTHASGQLSGSVWSKTKSAQPEMNVRILWSYHLKIFHIVSLSVSTPVKKYYMPQWGEDIGQHKTQRKTIKYVVTVKASWRKNFNQPTTTCLLFYKWLSLCLLQLNFYDQFIWKKQKLWGISMSADSQTLVYCKTRALSYIKAILSVSCGYFKSLQAKLQSNQSITVVTRNSPCNNKEFSVSTTHIKYIKPPLLWPPMTRKRKELKDQEKKNITVLPTMFDWHPTGRWHSLPCIRLVMLHQPSSENLWTDVHFRWKVKIDFDKLFFSQWQVG